MPKKRKIANDEPIQRPQRNMRAKKVFDPSDNYLPKKRNKFPIRKPVKLIESKTKLKCVKKKKQETKSKSSFVEYSSDCSPDENISTFVHSRSPSNYPVTPTEMSHAMTNLLCYLCAETGNINDLIDCPICLDKVHKDCLTINEPVWKLKLNLCPWLCESCREYHCYKCLKGDTELEMFSCITCKVGLHSVCYDTYNIKPLKPIEDLKIFVCMPCLNLATDGLPEEEEVVRAMQIIINKEGNVIQKNINREEEEQQTTFDKEEIEIVQDESKEDGKYIVEKESEEELDMVCTSSDKINVNNEDNNSVQSFKSYNSSFDYDKQFIEVPNVSEWDINQVYEYFADRLPKAVLVKIIKNEIDGRALLLLKRKDISYKMGLKLGNAMKFYKQIRILQSQSVYHKSYWE